MNCLRNHSPHIEGPTGCVYCHIEGLHRDADKQTAINAELLEALKDMSHASPAMQIAGGSVEIDMAGVDAKPGTIGWLTAARVWRAMCDVKIQSCFEEAVQPAPQPPSPAEIIALAKSVGAARSEGWGKWTFTYDQLQDFALKVSHWVHAEDKPDDSDMNQVHAGSVT